MVELEEVKKEKEERKTLGTNLLISTLIPSL